ncbi:unnamed protein product [Phytomonas sp. EM1]|nr:unnamed protein product [Phytomonas sp. EM1]|eukprot:CCW59601.1 unnamed protein product [Phytomonas sp. isolate EM1]
MSFTFAAAPAASNQAGAQNNPKPNMLGFSSIPAASTTPMANTGFGTFNTGFMKPGGTFTSGTGISNTATGVGNSAGGFPSTTGFSSITTGFNSSTLNTNLTPQLPPYKGIKGPGYAKTWQNTVDFSQINDYTLFDSLPPTLQQHLMELYAFSSKEEESVRAVTDYLNDIKPIHTGKGTANSKMDTNSGSYRHQSRQLAELKGGSHAVPIVAVSCENHEKEAQSFSQHLDQFESIIREYQHRVWEPLLASGNLTRAKNNNSTNNSLGSMNSFDHNVNAKSPLLSIVEELQGIMRTLSGQIEELKMNVMPSLTPNHLVNAADSAKQDRSLCNYASNVYLSHVDGRTPLYRNTSLNNYSNRCDRLQFCPSTFSPLGTTVTTGFSGSALEGDPTQSSEVIPQINASLMSLFTSLMNLSSWAGHLHKRTDTARGIFTRQYGQYEADVLFKPPIRSQETPTLVPGLSAPVLPAANPVAAAAPTTQMANFSVMNTATNTLQTAPAATPVGGFGSFGQGLVGSFGGWKTNPVR